MKKLNIIYIALMVFLGAFSSCKKDELNSKELLAFIKTDGADGRIGNINFLRTPVSVTGSSETRFAAYLTRETTADVSLTVSTDESKLAQYNTANKTAYVLLPASNYKIAGSGTLSIKAGTTTSADSLKIQLIDRVKLTDPNGYLLPLSINQVNSDDKGIQPSSTYRTVYVVVNSVYSNIDLTTKVAVTGTIADRTNPAWTIVAASPPYSSTYGAANTLDGKNTTSWFASGVNSFITLDMAVSNTIKGFTLMPSYAFGASYNATGIEVQISNDNVTWTSQGTYTTDPVLSTSSANAPDNRNINFYGPVTCRYVKFIMKVLPSSYGGFSEINAIK
ncbi:BT_3987 domain-containing protein [Pedobacter nototheniae]|uniref:BT_3987 domain-containing protein n=1 Tax=Pedobacter nototheniae TaxID=2488994 RepID=UPI00292F67A6|nr:DUF1735 domain-containing protein [Pedobacter nototheniae]